MALKIIDHGSPEYLQMIQLRNEILRKPLGLSLTADELEKEKNDTLIAALDDDTMLGCCMLVKTGPKDVLLRQIAVLNNLQGKGVGRALLIFAETIARDQGFKSISMHARKTAIPFFEKLGYQIQGDEFEKIGIPHVIMGKTI